MSLQQKEDMQKYMGSDGKTTGLDMVKYLIANRKLASTWEEQDLSDNIYLH
jgi:hypothetical protein